MCGLFLPASCRICLSSDIQDLPFTSYTPLTSDHNRSEHIGLLLELQTRLNDLSLYPQFICSICSDKINDFLELKEKAQENERIILKYQAEIEKQGVKFVLNKIEGESSNIAQDNNWENKDEKKINKAERFYKCKTCTASFDCKQSLRNHMKTNHTKKSKM